jgi:hypothetical protein
MAAGVDIPPPPLEIEQGLLLLQARDSRLDSAIQMFGDSMDLGVVWVNSEYSVVDLVVAKKWWTIHVPKSPARYIIGCRPDRLEEFNVRDELRFENLSQ